MPSKERTFANFGEYLYWSYANLQMLHYAVKEGKRKYDRNCYMIRSKAFKAHKEGKWKIHDLMEFNISKIQYNNYCWYCGKIMEPSNLTKDHVFPRSKVAIIIWIILLWFAKPAIPAKERRISSSGILLSAMSGLLSMCSCII